MKRLAGNPTAFVLVLALLAGGPWGCCSRDQLPPEPGFDGYFGSKRCQTRATGYFRVAPIGGRWWLITPEGHPFFSTGFNVLNINGTATHDGAKHYKEAALARYGSQEAWAEAQFERCKAWGFNSVGGWSQWELFRDRLPYTVILSAGESDDYFSAGFADQVRQRLQPTARRLAYDPYLIGYFLNNEMYWGFGIRGFSHFLDSYMKLPLATSPGKARLMAFLKNRYQTIAALSADFDTAAADWEALARETVLTSRGTAGAIATRKAWPAVVADRFFSITDEALRQADPNHLNLGVRFISQLVPRSVIEVAGRYVDVMSINFYELVPGLAEVLEDYDPDYLPVADFLAAHYQAGGRPILISEWGYRAADSGLPNTFPPIYPTLATQRERADAFEAYFREVLSRPWFVGLHWFLHADQPPEGRFDGEDNNFGFVTEQDAPYGEMTARSAKMYREIYRRLP